MVATAEVYAQTHPGVEIVWDKRPLQAFADFPIHRLARDYDLIVIDHPHVGAVSQEDCLVPLDTIGRDRELAQLASRSLGASHASYEYSGHQWALAIDAAAQVSAYRSDLIMPPPSTWSEVIAFAQAGRVLWPLKPVDALMSFFTLTANRGTPCAASGDELIRRVDGLAVLEAMQALARLVPHECLAMNPIQVLDRMSMEDAFVYCPLLFGYSNYSREGFRPRVVRFTNIPSLGTLGPVGSTLGGAGLAISAWTVAPEAAADYAFWVASDECQKGLYFASGGQPANAAAWDDPTTNAVCHDYFRSTRATLDRSWLRPRYPGYLEFQDRGGELINSFLAGNLSAEDTMRHLETTYRNTRP